MPNRGQISRVKRSKREAQAAYDRMSDWYDLITDPFEGKYRRQGFEVLDPNPGEWILEIGCGPGQTLRKVAQRVGPSGRTIGLDLSGAMLQRAHNRLREFEVEAPLVQGDAAAIPLHHDRFDKVFISFTLELFDTPEIPLVLKECKRTLKGGGNLVVVSMAKQSDPNAMTKLYEWAHQQFPRYADCRPIWVQRDIQQAGFKVEGREDFSMMGLPGAIIRARKL